MHLRHAFCSCKQISFVRARHRKQCVDGKLESAEVHVRDARDSMQLMEINWRHWDWELVQQVRFNYRLVETRLL